MGILTTVRGRQVINSQREREGGRERQREMYFQLFLLISPVLGMPNKAAEVGSEVVNELQSFIDFSKETGDLMDNSQWIKEVFVSLENTEPSVLDLEVELKTMPYSDETGLGLEGNFFPAYNEAKRYLRETEQKLREFAYKTVAEVRDLKTLFAAVEENIDQDESQDLHRLPIQKMENFMKDTLKKLEEAHEKYESAKNTFEKLLNFSIRTEEQVEKMLKEDSDERKNWVDAVTEAVKKENNETAQNIKDKLEAHFKTMIENEKDTKVKEKVQDFVKNNITAEIQRQVTDKLEAGIDDAIVKYFAKLETLKTVTEKMSQSGKNFKETITRALDNLTTKINTIKSQSAKIISKNNDKYSQVFLAKHQDIRTEFIMGLDDLKISADTFLAK